MRGLRSFGLLCAGVVVLVACWLVAWATLACLTLQPTGGLWALLGIPLVAVLLLVGFGLAMAFEEDLEPPDAGPTSHVLIAFFFLAFGALVVAAMTTDASGAQIYHVHFGERTEAVVTYIGEINNEYGNVVEWIYHVDDSATGEDLGQLATYSAEKAEEGDRLAVSVDPHGWMPPVPVDRMGWTAVPSTILLCCAGAVALGALAVVVTGLGELATRRPR